MPTNIDAIIRRLPRSRRRKIKDRSMELIRGSGNVFRDLGFKNADELQRAALAEANKQKATSHQ